MSTDIAGDGFVFFSLELLGEEYICETSSSDFVGDDDGNEDDDDVVVGEICEYISPSLLTFLLWISKFMKFQYVPKLNSTFRS